MKGEGRHWPILFAAFVTQALTHGFIGSMGVFYVEWKKAFAGDLPGDGSSILGWLTSTVLGVTLSTAPLSGALAHHYGVRPVAMVGGVLSTTGLFITSFAKEVHLLFFTVPLMTGLGCGLSYVASVTVIAQYFHKHFAFANGIASTGISIGVIVLPIITQSLINYYTWRNAIVIIAGIQAQVMICGAIMKPVKSKKTKENMETTTQHCETDRNATPQSCAHTKISSDGNGKVETVVIKSKKTKENMEITTQHCETDRNATPQSCTHTKISSDGNSKVETVVINGRGSETAPSRSRFRVALDSLGISLLWTNRVYACTLPMFFCNGGGYSNALIYIKERAKRVGVLDFESALLISIIGISGFFARAGYGYFIDAKIFHSTTVYCFANFLIAIALPMLSISDQYAVFVLCAVAIGFAAGLYIALNFVIVRSIVGVSRFPGGMGLALLNIAASIMSTVAISGFLLDYTGDFLAGFLYGGLLHFSCGIICLINHLVWTRWIKDPRWPPPLPSTCKKDQQNRNQPTEVLI